MRVLGLCGAAQIERRPRGASRAALAPMYGLAYIVDLLLNMVTRLHLCIRPIRGSLSLLANIGVSSQCADYVQATKAGRSEGIILRRSYQGSMFTSRGWGKQRPGGVTL